VARNKLPPFLCGFPWAGRRFYSAFKAEGNAKFSLSPMTRCVKF
jgi:hypothetical protein